MEVVDFFRDARWALSSGEWREKVHFMPKKFFHEG
jgi:hypothetical protein